MIDIATSFPYLGARDYIHATSLLSGFLEALEAGGRRGITVKRFKFQRPATSNGRLLLAPDALPAADLEAANCTLVATVDGAPWQGLFTEQGLRPERREAVDYPITELQAHGFGGTCRIASAGRRDLIRALVEANKRFHEAALADEAAPAVRFGYLESWPAPPPEGSFSGRLEATNLIVRKTSDGYLTINRLAYSGENIAASLVLCFNVTTGVRAP